MKNLNAVWCFLTLALACAVSVGDLGYTVIFGLSLFFWSALVWYSMGLPKVRGVPEVGGDQLLARMQTPEAKEAMQKAFDPTNG